MRLFVPLALFALACTPTTTVVGGGGEDSASGDTDSGGDTDTGTDTGTDSGDTEDTAPPDTSEGEYVGTIEGSLENDWQPLDCSGEATLTVDADGNIEGYLLCEFEDAGNWTPPAQEGDAVGAELDGDVELTWTVAYYNYEFEIPGVGSYEDGVITADFELDLGYGGYFTGSMEVERK